MGKKNELVIVWVMAVFVFFGLGAVLARAGDVEFILGTSSEFKVVPGTSVSSDTATVNVGTTSQSSMLTVVGASTSSSDNNKVILISAEQPVVLEEKKENPVVPSTTFTWSWVAGKIAESLIGKVAAKIFPEILGEDNINLNNLTDGILRGVAAIVHQAIQEDSLRQVCATMDSLQTEMRHYTNSPDTSLDRLEVATDKASEIVAQLSSFGLMGHHAYMVANGLFMAVLQERVKRFGDRENKNVIDVALKGSEHARRMHEAWFQWNNSRFSALLSDNNSDDWSGGCHYMFDGSGIFMICSKEIAELKRFLHINSEWQKVKMEHVDPAIKVTSQWEDIAYIGRNDKPPPQKWAPVSSWEQVPGSAIDIGIGANGAVWIVGTNPVPGGFGIYRWAGTGWEGVPGGATNISVDPDGLPWVVNDAQCIFRRDAAGNWVQMPEAAIDIGIGAYGTVYVIGNTNTGPGNGIFRWNGNGWVQLPGAALRVAVDPSGLPWHTNCDNGIYRLTPRGMVQIPGAGTDVGIGADGTVYVIGDTIADSGYGIYRWVNDNNSWMTVPDAAVRIAVDPFGHPWVVNSEHAIFRWK